MGFPDPPHSLNVSDVGPNTTSQQLIHPTRTEKKILSFSSFYRERVTPEDARRLDQLCALEEVANGYQMFTSIVNKVDAVKGVEVEDFMREILVKLTKEEEPKDKKETTERIKENRKVVVKRSLDFPPATASFSPKLRISQPRKSTETVAVPVRKSERVKRSSGRYSEEMTRRSFSFVHSPPLAPSLPIRKSERKKKIKKENEEETSPQSTSYTDFRSLFKELIHRTPTTTIDFDLSSFLTSGSIPSVSQEVAASPVIVTKSCQEPSLVVVLDEEEDKPPALPIRDYMLPEPTLIPLGSLQNIPDKLIEATTSSRKRPLDSDSLLQIILHDHDYALPSSKRNPEVISLSDDDQ